MSHAEKIIEVKAKSIVRFQNALGKEISLEDAKIQARKEYLEELQYEEQNQTWVDITTGRRVQGQF